MTSITIWTRLEPRCRTADMAPALEARTHDPLWMLSRQWQLGEFLGDDAGSPILAAIESVDMPLDRYAGANGAAASMPGAIPLETWVEREAVRPSATVIDYQQSAEAGVHFLRLLRAAGLFVRYGAEYTRQYPIALITGTQRAGLDKAALRLADLAAGRVPDGVRLAADLRAKLPGLPRLPVLDTPDERTRAQQVARDYVAWYDALFDEPPRGSAQATTWVDERMEYQFAIDSSATDAPGAFVAERYTGDPLDWTTFDRSAAPLGSVAPPPPATTRRLMPTPVSFKGMPARRFWEIEDAAVDMGAIEAGPADLGRLLVREFALVYGNDWFIIPLPVQVGSVSRIVSLVVTDTFGVAQSIPHYADTADGGNWQIFAISGASTDHRLLMPPVLARGLVSDSLEQVLLVRDEAANLAWGVERVVQGASGAPVDRASTEASLPSPASAPGGPSLRYRLGSSVPAYFIPFVPASIVVDPAAVPPETVRRMRRAAFLSTDGKPAPIAPRGRFLSPDVPLFEEEFAREGVRLDRAYRLARWTDGSTHLWMARRKLTGAQVGSSGLQFDQIDTV
jgi:hypothetical protein